MAWGSTRSRSSGRSAGQPDTNRLTVRFADRERAVAFMQPDRAGALTLSGPGKTPPAGDRLRPAGPHRAIPGPADAESIFGGVAAPPQGRPERGILTPIQRASLFDGLERVEQPTREDRIGHRLGSEGSARGSGVLPRRGLVAPRTRAFSGGEGTIPALVRPFGGAHYRHGQAAARHAHDREGAGYAGHARRLADYDRVSRVDLPPILPPVRFTIHGPEPEMDQTAAVSGGRPAWPAWWIPGSWPATPC